MSVIDNELLKCYTNVTRYRYDCLMMATYCLSYNLQGVDMTKTILGIFSVILVTLFSGCAQPIPSEQRTYVEVVEHTHKHVEAHELSKMWLANAFNDSKAVIEYDNKEKGIVIGQGIFRNVDYGMMVVGDTRFTLEIEVKDGKSRFSFRSMVISPDTSNPYLKNMKPYNLWNLDQLEHFKIPAKELVGEYTDYLSKGSKKSNW